MRALPRRHSTSGTCIVRLLATTTSMTPLPGRRSARSKNLTLQYDQVLFILEPNEITRSLACKAVMVLDYPDGRFAIRHNGVDLPYRTFDKRQRVNQAAIVENKRLGPVLAYIAREAEGTGHVALVQGPAPAWPAQS